MKFLQKQNDTKPAEIIKKITVAKLMNYDDFVFSLMNKGKDDEINTPKFNK
ncbi:MAG: hypothetical protein RL308_1314 [Bacteroidota bacterium]|jgi:hypothetical protein